MHGPAPPSGNARDWEPIPDSAERYSSGIPDFDRLMGGGFPKGGLALFHTDESIFPQDLELLLTPTFPNFLYQSRGILAVLPARESPDKFRRRLIRFATRRRFDSRVRVIDYVGEAEGSPYVVSLKRIMQKSARKVNLAKMENAARAVRGVRGRPFIELVAFEIMEVLAGAEQASRMFLHGVKRARTVSNLVIGLLRPGLICADSVRAMADTEFFVSRNELGMIVRGGRPDFPTHLATWDTTLGAPHVSFVPRP